MTSDNLKKTFQNHTLMTNLDIHILYLYHRLDHNNKNIIKYIITGMGVFCKMHPAVCWNLTDMKLWE